MNEIILFEEISLENFLFIPALLLFTYRIIFFISNDFFVSIDTYYCNIKRLEQPFINEIPKLKIYSIILLLNFFTLYNRYIEYIEYPDKNLIDKCRKCHVINRLWLTMFNNFIWLSFNHDVKMSRIV